MDAYDRGIIPALAGNTRRCCAVGPMPRDHPRACGEHETNGFDGLDKAGSSPRLRGTLVRRRRRAGGLGIIPALAGNTSMMSLTSRGSRDHPRACGEHVLLEFAGGIGQGSSPRLRGTHERAAHEVQRVGIIPALAGNTAKTSAFAPAARDHPRACGEHRMAPSAAGFAVGSSPRLRGTQPLTNAQMRGMGIIPALAGNTTATTCPPTMARDHPRACGEHPIAALRNSRTRGSSPRLRGTPRTPHAPPHERGIIPALAGNTWSCLSASVRYWDHPRACGEHWRMCLLSTLGTGSSPRLRGTRRYRRA